jgi:hypothetical protein
MFMFNVTQEMTAENNYDADTNSCDDYVGVKSEQK